MSGRGLVPEEEKRSYGAVFLFAVSLLVACTVWAVWQDVFSRHLWKKHKTDFYRVAIDKYSVELEEDAKRLADDPQYKALTEELAAARKSLESGEAAARLRALQLQLDDANVKLFESDLDLRIVKGEVEEAWYLLEHAQQHGDSSDAEHKHLEEALARKDEYQKRYDDAQAAVDATAAEMAAVGRIVSEVEEKVAEFYKNREAVELKLDGVSFSVFGRRVPHVPVVEQTVLKGFDRNNFDNWVDRVERCTNCHTAIDRPGFEDQPNPLKTHPNRAYYIGNHESRRFGCTPCHGGQGASINSVEQAHGKVDYWEEPLADIKDKVQAKCLTCHSSVLNVEGAGVAARGEWLFREMGCHGCHLVGGFEDIEKVGPSLVRLAAKVPPEWLVSWIRDPKGFRSRTRMPDFVLDDGEAVAMAAYLLDTTQAASRAWLDASDEPAGVDAGDATLVAHGKTLTQTLGCLGCHGFEAGTFSREVALGKDIAPNLARIAEKTDARWIYNWVRDPRGYSEHSRMPSLRLTDEEAAAITSYLLTLREDDALPVNDSLRTTLAKPQTIADGAKLIRKYGCYGCHYIPGMEAESRVSVELSSFGDKHLEELYFGDRLDIPFTWDDWTINKILTPRTYETERIEQNMPVFGFEQADARALTVFLASRTERVIHPDYLPDRDGRAAKLRHGRELVTRYNCQGCHSFDGEEGAIRAQYKENIENAPPILVGEGTKVQPEWFFDFVMKPVRLRPWLTVRMPTFGLTADEATAIVDYFVAVDGFDLGDVILEASDEAGPAHVPAHTALPEGTFDCYACHKLGTKKPDSTEYMVSEKPLTSEEVHAWMNEHFPPPVDQAVSDANPAGGGEGAN